MKIFPREHGATVIWFVALLASVFTMPYIPSLIGIAIFFTVSIVILMLTSYLTNVAPMLIKIRQNQFWLPIISSGLTLITPLGHYIMFAMINEKIFSVWLFLVTYTIFSVILIQRKILSLLKSTEYSSLYIFLFSIIIFTVESVIVFSLGWMTPFILLVSTPLMIMWLYLRSQHITNKFLKSKKHAIRSIGFYQTINMIFFVTLLTFISKF